MDLINITMFGIILLVFFYKNWIPGIMQWVQDRVHEK